MAIGSAALGGVIVGGLGLIGGQQANSANAEQASNARQFSEMMRDTSYQATVADMQKAGLNPMLAYSQGANATPGAAMATMQNVLGPAASSGMSAYESVINTEQKRQQVQQSQEQTRLIAEQAIKTSAETDNVVADTSVKKGQTLIQAAEYNLKHSQTALNESEKRLYDQQVMNAVLTGQKIKADTANTKVNTLLRELDVNRGKSYSDLYGTDFGHSLPYLDPAINLLHGAGQAQRGY